MIAPPSNPAALASLVCSAQEFPSHELFTEEKAANATKKVRDKIPSLLEDVIVAHI